MEFELTQRVSDAVALCSGPSASGESAEVTLERLRSADCKSISLADMQLLSKRLLQQHASWPIWVHELLQGALLSLPIFKQERKPNPALAPRLAQLCAAQEHREYAAMMGDVYQKRVGGREGAEMVSFRSQISVGLNLLVSMGTMFCLGFWSGGTAEEPHGVRATLSGLSLMGATLMLEMTLFLIGASHMDKQIHQREQCAARDIYDLSR